jgi:excisionase family DNA binding protein
MKILDVPEACGFLKLKKSSLYALVKAKAIPCFRRPGSRELLFDQEELEAWLRTGRVVTLEEATGCRDDQAEATPAELRKEQAVDISSRRVHHRSPALALTKTMR